MRIWLLHYVAYALGVLIHIDGIPHGRASRKQRAAWPKTGLSGEATGMQFYTFGPDVEWDWVSTNRTNSPEGSANV